MKIFKVKYNRVLESNNSQGENHPLWGTTSLNQFLIVKADDEATAKFEVEKELTQLPDSEDFLLIMNESCAEEMKNTSLSKSIESESA